MWISTQIVHFHFTPLWFTDLSTVGNEKETLEHKSTLHLTLLSLEVHFLSFEVKSLFTSVKESLQGSRTYYKYKSITRSKEISRKTKMRICRVVIRPVVTYGAETTNLTEGEEEKLRRFERKIYSPKKVVSDELRGPGRSARRAHCESCEDTEAAMERPHKKGGRRKSSEESDGVEIRLWRARGRAKSRCKK